MRRLFVFLVAGVVLALAAPAWAAMPDLPGINTASKSVSRQAAGELPGLGTSDTTANGGAPVTRPQAEPDEPADGAATTTPAPAAAGTTDPLPRSGVNAL